MMMVMRVVVLGWFRRKEEGVEGGGVFRGNFGVKRCRWLCNLG